MTESEVTKGVDELLRKIDIDRTEYVGGGTLSLGYHLSSSEIAQIKQIIFNLLATEAVTITERIESGGEYISTEAVPLSVIKEVFGVK